MIKVYDIETLVNCFTYTDLDIKTQEINKFVIHKDRNELLDLINHLNTIKTQIGFNNLNFDGQIIQFIITNYKKWIDLDGEQISNLIYKKAQQVIEKMNNGGFSEIPEWKMKIQQIDLFKIWHFDNKNKMTSLKWIEFMIDAHDIEEMPIPHWEKITKEQIDSILSYNKNDVIVTYELYKITKGNTELELYKGVDKIQLRKDIKKEFNLQCLNYNDVKIGDNINKLSYFNLANCDKHSLPKPSKMIEEFTFKDCFPKYYEFKTVEFNNFVNAISPIKVNLKKETVKSKKQVFEFTFNSTTYVMAKGGLHSKDSARLIIPNENELLRDCDVGSMYPNAIVKRKLFPRHLGEEWLIGYNETIKKRIGAKKQYKETKDPRYQAIQEAYKLSLNGGGFGKTNEESSWQFDPFVTYCVTIGSQIDLLMLIESLELAGIHVISANTDGLVCLFNKELEDTYYTVCKDWEVKVGNDKLGQLEYVDYKSLIQTSVNDYIAIKTNDEFKTKGDFTSEFELHKNKSARIIPLALQKYFIEGTPIEETLYNHQNIFDFCLGVKSIGKNRLIAFNKKDQSELQLQKINRYYISNSGVNILKKLPILEGKKASKQIDIFGNIDEGDREQEVEAGWLSTIYNKHKEKDIKEYNINYNYYIEKINKIIKQFKK